RRARRLTERHWFLDWLLAVALAECFSVLVAQDPGGELAGEQAHECAGDAIGCSGDMEVLSLAKRKDALAGRKVGGHQPSAEWREAFSVRHFADYAARRVGRDRNRA